MVSVVIHYPVHHLVQTSLLMQIMATSVVSCIALLLHVHQIVKDNPVLNVCLMSLLCCIKRLAIFLFKIMLGFNLVHYHQFFIVGWTINFDIS